MKLSLKQLSLTFLVIGIFSSCKKDLLDINVSPNDPTTASANAGLVLPNALAVSAAIYNNPTSSNNTFVFAGLWLGHISYSGNYAIATENVSYAITSAFAAGAFTNLYDNNEDYDFVEKYGVQTNNSFYRAIGMFMKAYNFQTLVDLYNNIPYFQALQGTSVSKPVYDDGKAVYDDLAKKMDTAILLFKTSAAGNTITGDIMFGGSAAKWATFANTVKLRLLLRQSEKNGAVAKTQASALAGGFTTADVTVNPGYLNSSGKTNPFWGANVNTSGTYTQDLYRAGQYAINYFLQNKDTFRLKAFFTPIGGTSNTIANSTNYAGNFFGDQGIQNSKTSQIGSGVLKSFSQPAVIMLAAESYFLQSEAVLRGWITGSGETAQTLYEKGVTASFSYLGLSAAQAQALYTQVGNKQTTWNATTGFQEQLALIMRQKWASEVWINELEPYNSYRRLRLPADIPLSTNSQSTGVFPNRLRYPQRELDVNNANTLAAGSDAPGAKIWWQP